MGLPFVEQSCGVPVTATDCVDLINLPAYFALTDENSNVIDYGYVPSGTYTVTGCGRSGYEYSNLKLYIGNVDQTYYDNDTSTYKLSPQATLVQYMPCVQGSYPRDTYYGILTQVGKQSKDFFDPISSSTVNVINTSIYPIVGIGVTIFLLWYLYKRFVAQF